MAMHSFTPQSESEFDGTKMNFHNGVPSMQPMYVQPGDFYIPSGSNVRRQNSQVSSKSNKSNNSVDSISSVGIGSMGEEEHEWGTYIEMCLEVVNRSLAGSTTWTVTSFDSLIFFDNLINE